MRSAQQERVRGYLTAIADSILGIFIQYYKPSLRRVDPEPSGRHHQEKKSRPVKGLAALRECGLTGRVRANPNLIRPTSRKDDARGAIGYTLNPVNRSSCWSLRSFPRRRGGSWPATSRGPGFENRESMKLESKEVTVSELASENMSFVLLLAESRECRSRRSPPAPLDNQAMN